MPSSNQIPDDINPAQQKAIAHRGSHLIIIAGPGTGKTHTLTYRIVALAEELQGHERILAITFTNKAAREMEERLAKRISHPAPKITVGTFHSFCFQFLRECAETANLPHDFKVAAPEEIEELIKEIWKGDSPTQRKSKLEQISRWK